MTVTGTWGPAADQVFISDRRQGSADGFWVVSPVMLEGSGAGAVMVVRGWVPAVSDPAAAAPTGPVQLSGAVVSSEAEDSSDDAAKGRVLSSLRIPTIVHLVDYRVYDAFVIQSVGRLRRRTVAGAGRRTTACRRRRITPGCGTSRMPSSGGCSRPSRCGCGPAWCWTRIA